MNDFSMYLAGPYQYKNYIQNCARVLENLGVTVTSSWLKEAHSPTTELDELPDNLNEKYALNDLRDIDRADFFTLFTVPLTDKPIPRAGRHVEFGYALAKGKDVYVIGGVKENIFHYLSTRIRHFKTFDDFVEYISGHPRIMGL